MSANMGLWMCAWDSFSGVGPCAPPVLDEQFCGAVLRVLCTVALRTSESAPMEDKDIPLQAHISIDAKMRL